jgi:hypothetical protein
MQDLSNLGELMRTAKGIEPLPEFPTIQTLHTGPIHSSVAGRTDHLPLRVPSDSYVLPADIVSAMGEGNTINGFKRIKRMFAGTPYGGKSLYNEGSEPYRGGSEGHAAGGKTTAVPVVVAGGEYVLRPEEVSYAGGGDVKRGHRVLDDFVKEYRSKTVKTLQKLPGPRKD